MKIYSITVQYVFAKTRFHARRSPHGLHFWGCSDQPDVLLPLPRAYRCLWVSDRTTVSMALFNFSTVLGLLCVTFLLTDPPHIKIQGMRSGDDGATRHLHPSTRLVRAHPVLHGCAHQPLYRCSRCMGRSTILLKPLLVHLTWPATPFELPVEDDQDLLVFLCECHRGSFSPSVHQEDRPDNIMYSHGAPHSDFRQVEKSCFGRLV